MKFTQIELLKKYGLSVRGNRGQHLLIDPNTQRKIVEHIELKPGEWILEIGPGLGALTSHLLEAGARVIAVEKDPVFCDVLRKEFAGAGNRLEIRNADILQLELKELIKGKTRKIRIVSNLPYYITTPILFRIIENRERVPEAILMMQREVANRLLAQPGEKDYGRLALAVRYYAEVERLFDVTKHCFTPQPEIDSAVLRIRFHPLSAFSEDINEEFLFHVIHAGFAARRKTLLHGLSADVRIGKSRQEVQKILEDLGFPDKVRAESLLLKDFIELSRRLS